MQRPLQRNLDNVRVVNVGSVSNPWPPDLRASYVVLDADSTGYRLDFHRVDYDHEAVVKAIQDISHPAGKFIIDIQRGKFAPPWNLAQ